MFSCNNSVSYKTDKLSSDRQQSIKAMIGIDKVECGDTTYLDSVFLKTNMENYSTTTKRWLFNGKSLMLKGNNFFKTKGIVPDEKTAADIAYIYLKNIYGEQSIRNELPLIVFSVNSYWFIEGTFKDEGMSNGGVAEILINKTDGKVIHVSHGK
ncbi:MAG: hypothetical protein HGB12_00595 [Bacteroidetes bacterium]|nr:hypothetical protein [Bacteroidota bacterium]